MFVTLFLGCAAIPTKLCQPSYHNPFPQLHRVAILPFFNLSENPHVDGERVALLYFEEMQAIPGFEILPVGVTQRKVEDLGVDLTEGTDYQELARRLNVDVLLIGAVTDFHPYYPPRMGLTVRWYAANPGFHPIPPGYGLPWGTSREEYIPKSFAWEAEFALAREQLETQTPTPGDPNRPGALAREAGEGQAAGGEADGGDEAPWGGIRADGLPGGWPDPTGFIPDGPQPVRPPYRGQREPIIRQTRIYHGNDLDLTRMLEDYYEFRDDARFGGWQAYLQRSDDFMRFCCYAHITETLASRGGVGEPKVLWRWPISRYDP
ncbi:MAG: hypothetical protein FJ297_16760 [Planctomycetes bacterium]|nr:hypothetical protein [Planctomycetota bacterium]